MKIVIWNLKAGNRPGQMDAETKKAEGYKYIQKLKDEGEKVVKVDELPDKFVIYCDESA